MPKMNQDNEPTREIKPTMSLVNTVTNIAEPIVADKGLVLAGIRINTEKGTVVQVLLENEDGTGANIDACTQVSRELGYTLEVEDTINQAYTLEVSSPGMNRPLFSLADVTRFNGKNAKIKLLTDVNDKKAHVGTLGKTDGDSFSIETTDGAVTIDWSNVKDAKLAPTNEEIQQLLKQKPKAQKSA